MAHEHGRSPSFPPLEPAAVTMAGRSRPPELLPDLFPSPKLGSPQPALAARGLASAASSITDSRAPSFDESGGHPRVSLAHRVLIEHMERVGKPPRPEELKTRSADGLFHGASNQIEALAAPAEVQAWPLPAGLDLVLLRPLHMGFLIWMMKKELLVI